MQLHQNNPNLVLNLYLYCFYILPSSCRVHSIPYLIHLILIEMSVKQFFGQFSIDFVLFIYLCEQNV